MVHIQKSIPHENLVLFFFSLDSLISKVLNLKLVLLSTNLITNEVSIFICVFVISFPSIQLLS